MNRPPIPVHRPHQPTLPVEHSLSPELTDLITRFLTILEPLMSKLTDAVSALTKAVDDAVARDKAVVDDLNKQVADLKAQLAAGGLTAAEEDALADQLAAAQAKVDALDPTSPVTLPPTP